jgi:hypothetical protein
VVAIDGAPKPVIKDRIAGGVAGEHNVEAFPVGDFRVSLVAALKEATSSSPAIEGLHSPLGPRLTLASEVYRGLVAHRGLVGSMGGRLSSPNFASHPWAISSNRTLFVAVAGRPPGEPLPPRQALALIPPVLNKDKPLHL